MWIYTVYITDLFEGQGTRNRMTTVTQATRSAQLVKRNVPIALHWYTLLRHVAKLWSLHVV
jgi:hypothetical protein